MSADKGSKESRQACQPGGEGSIPSVRTGIGERHGPQWGANPIMKTSDLHLVVR